MMANIEVTDLTYGRIAVKNSGPQDVLLRAPDGTTHILKAPKDGILDQMTWTTCEHGTTAETL